MMSRHRRSSFAQIYANLISPRHNPKPTCVAISSWTRDKWIATHRDVGTCAFGYPPDKRSLRHVSFTTESFYLLPRFPLVSVRYLSNDSLGEINGKGEECYKLAMEALNNASRVKQEHEERLMQEQFEAMEKQKNKKQRHEKLGQRERQQDAPNEVDDSKKVVKLKDRAAGVAVMRTIVKQSQQQNAIHVEQSFGDQSTDSTIIETSDAKANIINNWRVIAQKHMEEAAFRHGHGLALVRLGNEALERAKNNSGSTWLIDRDRCKDWMDESPLDLAHILVIGARMEGGGSDQYSNCQFNNEGEPISPYLHLALHVYEEAGKQGSAEGWYNFGHLLWDGGFDSNDDTKAKAMRAFHKAMKLGDADAMYFVASQYLSQEEKEEEGNELMLSTTYNQYGPSFITSLQANALDLPPITEQSKLSSLGNNMQKDGYKLLHIAANGHNHGRALHHLALLHIQENGNVEEFRQLLSKAAATGNPDSLFLQGHCYYSGTDGYNENFPAALKNFLAASESEHVDAMVSAGAMLHQGVVSDDGRTAIIERDQQRAFDLYQQAGELGSLEGWRNVVSCYASGQGVPKCLETAKYIANTLLKEKDS